MIGDYKIMTDVLRDDPVSLFKILESNRLKISATLKNENLSPTHRSELALALTTVEAALAKTVARLNRDAEAEAMFLAAASEETDEVLVEDEGQVMEEDVLVDDDLPDNDDPGEVIAEDVEPVLEEESFNSENPVAMAPKLRKAMSDPSADVMDTYAMKVYTSVMAYFENLTKRSLDLGAVDPSDPNSLKEVLQLEVGRRGLANVEANFAEWREALIKKIWKDISAMYAVTSAPNKESSDFPIDAPATPDTQALELPDTDVPPEEEEPIIASSMVSFTMHSDLQPIARKRVTLE